MPKNEPNASKLDSKPNSNLPSTPAPTPIPSIVPSPVSITVPTLGTSLGAADAALWENATIDAITQAAELDKRTDEAAHRAFSMALIDIELHDADHYKAILDLRQVGIPKNTDAITLGIAALYNLDVKDALTGNNQSKKLNSLGASMRELRLSMLDKTGNLAVTYDAAGVEKMVILIKTKKGLAKLETDYRERLKGNTAGPLVPLRQDELATLRLNRFYARAGNGKELIIGLGKREDDNAIRLEQELKLTTVAQAAIARDFIFPDAQVAFLGELLTVKECVIEYRTDILVDTFSDPDDKNAPRRLTHPHIVFHPEGLMTISPILMDVPPIDMVAGTVVTLVPKAKLLSAPVAGHVEFRTQDLPTVKANLSTDRVDAFEMREEATPGLKQTIARLILTSPVEARGQDDPESEVHLLVQRVVSKKGNFPLVLRDFAPEYQLEKVPAFPAMREIAMAVRGAGKKATSVKITTEPGKLSFSMKENEQTVAHDGTPKKVIIDVRADDFAALVNVLGKVVRQGEMSFGIHADMFVATFETASATYSVHIPKQYGGGVRSDRFMQKLEPTAWPGIDPAADEDDVAE